MAFRPASARATLLRPAQQRAEESEAKKHAWLQLLDQRRIRKLAVQPDQGLRPMLSVLISRRTLLATFLASACGIKLAAPSKACGNTPLYARPLRTEAPAGGMAYSTAKPPGTVRLMLTGDVMLGELTQPSLWGGAGCS